MDDLKSQLEQTTVQGIYQLYTIVFKFVMHNNNFQVRKDVDEDERHNRINDKDIVCRFGRTDDNFVVKMSIDGRIELIRIRLTDYLSKNVNNKKP
jgi:hypothetical protein